MPSRELGTVSGDADCCRCGRHSKKRKSKLLSCLLGLSLLGMFVLALPVLYLLSGRFSEKPAPEEMPTAEMPDAQRQHDVPPCNCSDSNIRPSVHVAADFDKISKEKCLAPQYPALYWYNPEEEGEGQIKLGDEGKHLIIPKDGRYFVYSQVTFYCPDSTCEGVTYCEKSAVDETMVTQMISHQNTAYDGALSTVFLSSSSIDKTKWSKTLYLAGIIQLKKDDKLMVNVSNPQLVQANKPEFTFFGLYLIT
ncbi:tumor necrosis factor ligand superfamily member 15-like [Python bivittatus]|uniref:Tumor necrosis factor ligand superfamily member 15-like n=1 Tax=Python bivittatus TaxID=176946 RepID=A0A9F2REW9_PYTBI|nr:tumor necrosis factor ligand superfamily member 15-like [Python bivittatus]